jgi:UDP-glucose 4-epimerase
VVAIGDIAHFSQWAPLLKGVDAVVHLAARAHVTSHVDDYAAFRRTNVDATVCLAQAAAVAGVRRFVFLSSIGVNGNRTVETAFTEADVAAPIEPYAKSKWDAEQRLLEIAASGGLDVVRVRPPLVIGPGVKGNLLRLLKMVDLGLPLPLGGIQNQRSFVALDDLCDLLVLCIEHPGARGELFLAADDDAVSTSELLRRIATGLGRRSMLFTPPAWALSGLARVAGLGAELHRLTWSLRVDASHARETLGWKPAAGIDSGIRTMARAYLQGSV